MEETITQEKAVQMALDEASDKFKAGHLYKSGDPTEFCHDWSQGDPETIYSIASSYSQFVGNHGDAHDAIIDALTEQYGEDYG